MGDARRTQPVDLGLQTWARQECVMSYKFSIDQFAHILVADEPVTVTRRKNDSVKGVKVEVRKTMKAVD